MAISEHDDVHAATLTGIHVTYSWGRQSSKLVNIGFDFTNALPVSKSCSSSQSTKSANNQDLTAAATVAAQAALDQYPKAPMLEDDDTALKLQAASTAPIYSLTPSALFDSLPEFKVVAANVLPSSALLDSISACSSDDGLMLNAKINAAYATYPDLINQGLAATSVVGPIQDPYPLCTQIEALTSNWLTPNSQLISEDDTQLHITPAATLSLIINTPKFKSTSSNIEAQNLNKSDSNKDHPNSSSNTDPPANKASNKQHNKGKDKKNKKKKNGKWKNRARDAAQANKGNHGKSNKSKKDKPKKKNTNKATHQTDNTNPITFDTFDTAHKIRTKQKQHRITSKPSRLSRLFRWLIIISFSLILPGDTLCDVNIPLFNFTFEVSDNTFIFNLK